MSFGIMTDVYGVKEALRVINKADKTARTEITANFQEIMQGTVDEIRQNVPGKNPPPISGFGRSWTTKTGFQVFPWNGVVYPDQIAAGVSGKKPRAYQGYVRNHTALYVRWSGTQAVVFDQAGHRQQNPISYGLEKKEWGKASRLMWPTVLDNLPTIENKIEALLDQIWDKQSRAMAGQLPAQIRRAERAAKKAAK